MGAARPIVAIVGRPNVGKSRLFNRFVRRARALVLDQPGVTRDRLYGDAVLETDAGERDIVIVDTGGFDPKADDPIMRRMLEQTQFAIDEADVLVFLTDGVHGLTAEDREIAKMLRKSGKPVVVAVNKIDTESQEGFEAEFFALGLPHTIGISALHGRNLEELEDTLASELPAGDEVQPSLIDEPPPMEDSDAPPTRVAVIGRPNVGKSSLINRILGEDRHLVSEVAGTTVDSVDSMVEFGGHPYLLIDTAGIRRKRSIAMRMERYSVVAALKGLERSDVALLLISADQPIADQDAKVSAFAYEKGKAVILVVSKWDETAQTMSMDQFRDKLREEIPHLSYAPVVFTSARTGFGVERLFPTVRKVQTGYSNRVSTSELNKFLEAVIDRTPPPSRKGRRGRIYYLRQIDIRPPRFLASVNSPELIHYGYRRFLVNELRKAYGFSGVPVLIGYRSHKSKDGKSVKKEAPKKRTSKKKGGSKMPGHKKPPEPRRKPKKSDTLKSPRGRRK